MWIYLVAFVVALSSDVSFCDEVGSEEGLCQFSSLKFTTE